MSLALSREVSLYLAPTSKQWAELSSGASHFTQILGFSAHNFTLPSLQSEFMHLTCMAFCGLICVVSLPIPTAPFAAWIRELVLLLLF